jgi:hypothetical protein
MGRPPDASITARRLLGAFSYPIQREDLLERARQIDAPSAIREAITRLPAGRFECRDRSSPEKWCSRPITVTAQPHAKSCMTD